MTANELIRRSLRSLGVLYHNESPTNDEANDALATLNDMLNAWLLEGMDLEVYENLELTDTLPYPDDHISAMRYGLAVELAPEYGVQVSTEVAAMAGKTYTALRAFYCDPDTLSTDSMLHPYNNTNGLYSEWS